MSAAIVVPNAPRERTSVALAAFFDYVAHVVEMNDERPDPVRLFGEAVHAACAVVNLGALPMPSADDCDAIRRMFERHLYGRGVTTRDIVNILRGLSAEVTP